MSTPIVMVTLIWQFTQIWNDFLFGVVFASGDSGDHRGLNNLVNITTGVKANVDMAAAMIAALLPRWWSTYWPASTSCAASPPAP